MRKKRGQGMLGAVIKGFFIAFLATVLMMAALTVAVWQLDVDDAMLTLLNQIMKIVSIALGTFLSVGRGGESGFLTGAVIGTAYMALGYGMYALMGGAVDASGLLGEWMIGAAAGALTGAITANLPAKKRRQTA